ncbi:unnamed protein product [Linum tenue]|uniref:Elongin-A n=1 Tax=Linum tenue TaxID=586396 RepID=A0AAV0KAC7_9ROSI|nr:unnamed protein product [Linum tenue]
MRIGSGPVFRCVEKEHHSLTGNNNFGRTKMLRGKRRTPSLVDLCVELAIENVKYLGDVGETDSHLLSRILPHCTLEQLTHVEKSTVGRDLSTVTDPLWRKFYEKHFGQSSTNLVLERMKQKKVSFQWKQLYEAKVKDVEDAENKAVARLRERYKSEDALFTVVNRKVFMCLLDSLSKPPLQHTPCYLEGLGEEHMESTCFCVPLLI